ncbi:MAG: hypothetical protein GKS03_15670 [Alphaproteobacteria bacterium]|nr:hypothetical protein [Alphaproteobacteria bacterium]
MRRRTALGSLFGLICLPIPAPAQISQRARQIRDRQACEQNHPSCRAEIRVQLEAEQQRLKVGLVALALGVFAGALVLVVRHRRSKYLESQGLERLHGRVKDLGGDLDKNGAK